MTYIQKFSGILRFAVLNHINYFKQQTKKYMNIKRKIKLSDFKIFQIDV